MNDLKTRPHVVIESHHQDASGGGRYTLQLAQCFSRFADVYFAGQQANDVALTNIRDLSVRRFAGDFTPDLFVAVSHWGGIKPIGKMNAHVVFFPMDGNDSPHAFDSLICLNEFVRLHSSVKFPELRDRSFVICPAIEPKLENSVPPVKQKLLLNVGNYFMEDDGHSKNQHVLLKWFADHRLYENCSFVFSGFVVTQKYYDDLCELARGIPNVHILSAISRADLWKLYAQAAFLIHANGYGRHNYFQTEHFGYVAIEAMAAGCQPIVHNSGGCHDLPGVRVWNHVNDILPLMYNSDPPSLQVIAQNFSLAAMQQQVQTFWDAVCSRLAA
jgi:hypothetical protein